MKERYGALWMETNKDGTVSVGLTNDYIQNKLSECFHIIQADSKVAQQNDPLLVIETNDGLESLNSPVTGLIVSFNHRARNFPDKLKEEDVIMVVCPPDVKRKPVKIEQTLSVLDGFFPEEIVNYVPMPHEEF